MKTPRIAHGKDELVLKIAYGLYPCSEPLSKWQFRLHIKLEKNIILVPVINTTYVIDWMNKKIHVTGPILS